jgi:hypothetical protein
MCIGQDNRQDLSTFKFTLSPLHAREIIAFTILVDQQLIVDVFSL